MRKRSLFGSITAMTIASALTLSAQTSGSQTTPRTSGDQRSGADQTVTVTGCVQQNNAMGMSGSGSTGGTGSTATTGSGGTGSTGSTGSATGSASTAGSAGSATASGAGQGRFVLANAKMAQGSSTSALGSTTRFALVGMTDAELTKHVNHQVEVTGRLSAMGGSTSANRGGSATGTTGSGSTGSTTGSTGSGSTGGTGSTGAGSTGSTGAATSRTGGAMGSGMNDMPQLHATNIKMISATCPAQQ